MANQNDERFDNIQTVAKAALALGAGAAFLYRSGGRNVLSKGLRKTNHAFNEAINSLSNQTLKDINGNGKAVFKKALTTFKDEYKNYNDKLSLRLDSPNSALNILQHVQSLRNNETVILRDMYMKEQFIPTLKKQLQDNFQNVEARRINNIVDNITSRMTTSLERIGDTEDLYRLSDSFRNNDLKDFNESQKDLIESIMQERFLKKKEESLEFIRNTQERIYHIEEKLTDYDSMLERFGNKDNRSSRQQFIDEFLGDQQATFNDLIRYSNENPDEISKLDFATTANQDPQQIIKNMRDMVARDERYGELYIDASLRKDKDGNLYSLAEAVNFEQELENKLLHTFPGKLLKPLENRVYGRNVDNIIYLPTGSVDYQLPKLLEDRQSTILQNSYMYINQKGYRFIGNDLESVAEFDQLKVTSGRYGSTTRLMKFITGDVDTKEVNSPILKALDLGSSPKRNSIDNFLSRFTKHVDPDYEPNIIENYLNYGSHSKDTQQYFDDMQAINRMFKTSTKKLDRQSINILANNIQDDNTREIFDLLKLTDNDLISRIKTYPISNTTTTFLNEDLTSLILKYKRDPKKARSLISISEDVGQNVLGFKSKHTKTESYMDMVRKELSKEGFLRYKKQYGDDAVFDLIENSGLTSIQKTKASKLASWSIFQQEAEVYSSRTAPYNLAHKIRSQDNTNYWFLAENQKATTHFQNSLKDIMDDFPLLEEGPADSDYLSKITKANRPNDYIFIKKAINPFDIIKAENKDTMLKSFFKQFTAGRNNMEDVTTATIYPYFMLHRLTDAVPGLGFSPENTGNVLDLAKNIMTKRVLPVTLGITAFNYLNFESRNLTGKSLTEAFVNSYANFDLGIRGITDAIGLSDRLKDGWYTNPLSQYLKEDPYRTQEEQLDYLKTGYKPVRKGRWWGLSNSEFRGGKITYFEPNTLRQVSVPWQDISLYGSEDEKWKHSWLPTPRHPLSPIRNLLDPYWLEKKHKYDRPYPVSAPLFSEGTPWSAIGNATLGNLIKPVRRLNTDVLGRDLIDVRDLIAEENQRIKDRASIESITITGSNTATEESIVPTDNIGQGYGIAINNVSSSNILSSDYGANYTNVNINYNNNNTKGNLNLIDHLILTAINTDLALPQLQNLNEEIKYKAYTRGAAQTTFAKQYDNLIAYNSLDIINDKSVKNELLNISSKKEFINNLAYSTKELSGMYGFLLETAIPSKKQHRLETANNMYSFSSRFWDENLGGTGGEMMEIARRFFPHENRDVIDVNPLRNTMASWLPDNFKHGDPYTKLPKGEIRLPGAGYEAINHYKPKMDFTVHPLMIGSSKKDYINYFLNKSTIDEQLNRSGVKQINVTQRDLKNTQKYILEARKTIDKLIRSGRINSGEFYDDFQRFKILADVAPYSQEYKEYKGKVKDKLTPAQRKEYNQILTRVDRQNKKHDFFSYQYKGFKSLEKEGYIDQINGSNFTLVGSNQIYSLAGVSLKDKNILSQYLAEGMKVKLTYDKLDANDSIIKTSIMTGTENLNRKLVKDKVADRNIQSAIDTHALATSNQKMWGSIGERIGHLPIPYIHNRYLKLETARESYENEQIYGTPYATWNHPIQGYIQPAINKAINSSPLHATLGAMAFGANVYVNHFTSLKVNKHLKTAANVANLLITPGAFAGSLIGYGINLSPALAKKGMYAGSAIWAGSYLLTNAKNPIIATSSGAILGHALGEFLEKGTGTKGMKTGALIGLGVSFLRNPDFKLDKAFGKWIPDKVEKRWDLEEYFDRLEYIKYKGLYEKAAQMAYKKEGVSIKQILNDMEKAEQRNKKKVNRLLKYKQNLSNNYMRNTIYGQQLLNKLDKEIYGSNKSITIISKPYTKSALAYKQAMDSTMYGLKENASWAQILRALPQGDRDYFLEFAKEKDPKERKKILKVVSPYKRRILQQLWGEKVDRLQSNESYFKSHKLPSMFWAGWKPKVDIEHIKMKTIQNEGMLLSDFGLYDSALDEPGAREAEPIRNYNNGTNLLELKKNLFTSLTGIGLTGVEVSIEQSQKPGIEMITNFIRISDYQVKQRINNLFGRSFY